MLESLDNGKPIRETRDIDVPLVARHFYHHAGWAQLMERELPGRVPVGVIGQIIPWNFPLLMLAWKIAPALAMGNTVVLKPAEFTSLTALRFAELCEEAGLPPGVVNIITGDGRTGAALVEHPDVDKIAFTGSTEVGRIIRNATAGSGKKLSLELGGKSPFIVFDDADLDSVVEGVVDAIWFNQGQVCCAGSRLLVQEGVAERLIAKLRARMETLRLGDPLDKAVDMGAIVAPVQLERIEGLVRQGQEEGADDVAALVELPDGRLVLSADALHRRRARRDHRAGRDLRAGARADDLPHAGGGGRAGQQHPLRPRGERLDREHQPRARHRAEDQGGNGVDQLHQPVRRRRRVRRLSRERVRARGRAGGAVGVCEVGGGRRTADGRTGGTVASGDSRSRKTHRPSARIPPSAVPPSTARPPFQPSTAPPSSTSAASRRAPTRATACRCSMPRGRRIGEVGQGNRKDIRNAVEAAHKAAGWARTTAHQRAQILYYIAENLAARAEEFGAPAHGRSAEVALSVERLFT